MKHCCVMSLQRSDRVASDTKTAASSDAGTAASDESGIVVASKPFYPEVTISHVETPSKFYVLEMSRKDSLDA